MLIKTQEEELSTVEKKMSDYEDRLRIAETSKKQLETDLTSRINTLTQKLDEYQGKEEKFNDYKQRYDEFDSIKNQLERQINDLRTGRVREADVTRMFGHLRTLLEGMAADPERRLRELPFVTGGERDQVLVEWNATGRERAAKRRILRPREAAPELLAFAEEGPVALVAGREASGLTNEELDACQTLVTISTDPSYTSLNLAQAIAVMCHELWTAAGGDARPFKRPRRRAPLATGDELDQTFNDWRRGLWAIDFFKTRQEDNVLRSLREVVSRATLVQREGKLLRAMGIEMVRFMDRQGLDPVAEGGRISAWEPYRWICAIGFLRPTTRKKALVKR